jgi:CheY-like chemotaxis protein
VKRILVVEDNELLRVNLEDILTSEGYEVVIAVDGGEGYEKAQATLPDLIISDIQMPVMNGLDLLELLQRNPLTESIPVIIFSAHTEPTYIRKGMSIGADDYITKPFKIDDLLSTITARLKKREKQNQKADNFKNTVIKKVAHELRTPLISILSYPQLLKDNIDDLSIEEIKEIAENMKQSGDAMYRNVEKILLYSELLYFTESMPDEDSMPLVIYSLDAADLKRKIEIDLYNYSPVPICGIRFSDGKMNISGDHYWYLIRELMGIVQKWAGVETNMWINGEKKDPFYSTSVSFTGEIPEDFFEEKDDNTQNNENSVGSGLGLGTMIVRKITGLYRGGLRVSHAGGKAFITVNFKSL